MQCKGVRMEIDETFLPKFAVFLGGSHIEEKTSGSRYFYNAFLTFNLDTKPSANYVLQNIAGGDHPTPTTDALYTSSAKIVNMKYVIFAGGTVFTLGQSLRTKYAFVSTYPTSSVIQNDMRTFKLSLTINDPSFNFKALSSDSGQLDIQYLNMSVINSDIEARSIGMRNEQILPDKIPKGIIGYNLGQSVINIISETVVEGETKEFSIPLKFSYSIQCSDTVFGYGVEVSPDETPIKASFDGSLVNITVMNLTNVPQRYYVKITAYLSSYISTSVPIEVRVISSTELPNYQVPKEIPRYISEPPYFSRDLPEQIQVIQGFTNTLIFPPVMVADDHHSSLKCPPISMSCSLLHYENDDQFKSKTLPDFINFDPQRRRLTLRPTSQTNIGLYCFNINLVNQQSGLSKSYELNVNVVKGNYYNHIQTNKTSGKNDNPINTSSTSTPEIQPSGGSQTTSDNTGKFTYNSSIPFPIGKIRSLTNQGIVRVGVRYQARTPDSLKFIDQDYVYFKIAQEEAHQHDLKWEFLSISDDRTLLTFKLTFNYHAQEAEFISDSKSKIILCFLPRPMKERILPKSQALYCQDQAYLPVQIPDQQSYNQIEITGQVVTSSIVTFMASNIFVSVLASGSLQLLWSFVNSLQLISYLPLLNLSGIPANIFYVLSLINGPMQFKLIDSDAFTMKLFDIRDDENSTSIDPLAINDMFANFGFNTNLALLNLNNTFYFLCLFPAHFIVLLLLKYIPSARVQKLRQNIQNSFQYGFLITLLLEDFIQIFCSCLINVINRSDKSDCEIFSLAFAAIILIVTLSIMIGLTYLVVSTNYRAKLKEPIFKKRFGSFYKEFDQNRTSALLFHPLFILRRLLFCISAMFLNQYPSVQVSLFILFSLLQVIYIGKVRPFKQNFKNILELINEFAVLLVSVFLPAFTDFISSKSNQQQAEDLKFAIGWIVLTVIFVQCFLNFLVQAAMIYRNVKKYLKKKKCFNNEIFKKCRRFFNYRANKFKIKSNKVHDIRMVMDSNICSTSRWSMCDSFSVIKDSPSNVSHSPLSNTPTNTSQLATIRSINSTPMIMTPNQIPLAQLQKYQLHHGSSLQDLLASASTLTGLSSKSSGSSSQSNQSFSSKVTRIPIIKSANKSSGGFLKKQQQRIFPAQRLETISERQHQEDDEQEPDDSSSNFSALVGDLRVENLDFTHANERFSQHIQQHQQNVQAAGPASGTGGPSSSSGRSSTQNARPPFIVGKAILHKTQKLPKTSNKENCTPNTSLLKISDCSFIEEMVGMEEEKEEVKSNRGERTSIVQRRPLAEKGSMTNKGTSASTKRQATKKRTWKTETKLIDPFQ